MANGMNRRRSRAHTIRVPEGYDRMVRAAGAHSSSIRRQQGCVHFIEAGEGPPVVHLHGNNTSSLSHLMLLGHLTAVRSFLVDRPGFGLSNPAAFPRKSYRECAIRFVDDVLDGLHLGSVVLAGASGGGTWAVWYALTRPERVRGLVLLGSVPLLPGAHIPVGIRVLATPVLGDFVSRTVKPGRRLVLRLMSSVGEGETILRHPDLLESLIAAARDPVAIAADVAEFRAVLTPLGPRPGTRIRPDLRHPAVHPDDPGQPRPGRVRG